MASFDAIAPLYDRIWTHTAVGDAQRRAVWRLIDPLFPHGASVLDLGCGTGADAVHLEQAGIRVYGVDASPEMVRVARSKGVEADVYRLENLAELRGRFDGAISNFGALNCVESLSSIAKQLARLIRRGGFVALCVLGRVCLWEMGYYSLRGNFRKALRRLSGRAHSSYSVAVFYPTRRKILQAFQGEFILCAHSGIGLTVPPSYVNSLGGGTLQKLAAFDERLAARWLFRSVSDHQLYILRRL